MAIYMTDVPADAAVYHHHHHHQQQQQQQQQQQLQPNPYRPQQAIINADGSTMGHGYMQGDAAMTFNGDYLGNNIYYPPPHAPRLSAAAARASSMAAMYYNPTLHPQHAFSSNVAGDGPWMPPHRSERFKTAPSAFQHQQLEHHLMTQNHAVKAPVPAFHASHRAVPAYGGTQQHSQQLPSMHHFQPRHSYPDDRQSHSLRQWNGPPQSNLTWSWEEPYCGQVYRPASEKTPNCSEFQSNNLSYFHDPSQQTYQLQQQQQFHPGNAVEPAPLSQKHTQPPPSTEYPVEKGWDDGAQGKVWGGQGGDQGTDWGPSYRPDGYSVIPQEGSTWYQYPNQYQNQQNNHTQAQQPRSSVHHQTRWSQLGAVDDRAQNIDAAQWTNQRGPFGVTPSKQTYSVSSEAANRDYPNRNDGAADHRDGAKTDDQRAPSNDTKNKGPAPPSPDTLDRSSVPISNIGAEIIWIACAALLDPDLLGASARSDAEEARFKAFGAADVTVSSEESSASSSEPGTPPSSFPTYLHHDDLSQTKADVEERGRRKGGPYGQLRSPLSTLQGLRGLGLNRSESTFEVSKHKESHLSSKVHSPSSCRAEESSISGVLNLISPSWKWSLNDDKLASLSSSLRDGAKVNVSPLQKANTYSAMKRSSSTSTTLGASGLTSTHGEQSNSVHHHNSAAALGSEASPAFRRFAHQVLAQTLVSPTAFMLAMMYSLRVPYLAIEINKDGIAQLDPEAAEIFAQPPSAAPFKLFALGLMIANKHLDDNTFLNKTWNEVTGISLSELNRMERWYLEKCSYEVTVPEEPWVAFLERLAFRTEGKLQKSNEVKRYRLPSKHRPSASVPSISSDSNQHSCAPAKVDAIGTSSSNEEAHKRLLLSIEEALVVLGRMAPFELNKTDTPIASSASPPQRQTFPNSPDIKMQIDGQSSMSNHQLHHHHCHSAPALALHHSVGDESEVDVFEDEDGPYRPQGASIQSSWTRSNVRKGSLDPVNLNRSASGNVATSTWHNHLRADLMRKEGGKMQAPLAPSVLLDLLNRGQQYAHAAH
ncbi:hypothetical protein CBS101457_006435 [Exobasidium rhododendri]|nr:hypothetical protein CBS101457_006435 [Exobasidium rhododendri]